MNNKARTSNARHCQKFASQLSINVLRVVTMNLFAFLVLSVFVVVPGLSESEDTLEIETRAVAIFDTNWQRHEKTRIHLNSEKGGEDGYCVGDGFIHAKFKTLDEAKEAFDRRPVGSCGGIALEILTGLYTLRKGPIVLEKSDIGEVAWTPCEEAEEKEIGWDVYDGRYLGGYCTDNYSYDTLDEAKAAYRHTDPPGKCGGITYENLSGKYTLRQGRDPQDSPTGEKSWYPKRDGSWKIEPKDEEKSSEQTGWVKYEGQYLGGYCSSQPFYNTLEEAQTAFGKTNPPNKCGGITYEKNRNRYTLRRSNKLATSSSGEISWLFQDKTKSESEKIVWVKYEGKYLGGYCSSHPYYGTLEEAQFAFGKTNPPNKCGGITFEKNRNRYTLRRSNKLARSPSGEISWLPKNEDSDKAEKEKAEKERKQREKAEREKAEREKAERERKEREKAKKEKAEREKAERERKEREKAEREKAERERKEREKAEREKAEREKAERERKEREKAKKEKAEREKAERERKEREKAEREKAERERKEREKAEREKAEREKAERERKEREKAEKEKAEREKAERERKEREKAEREKAERERKEREKAEREKAEREKAERERKEREKAEREKAEREKAERERKEREKAEREKAEREKAERERKEREKAKREKAERQKAERERKEREKAEREKAEREKAERERKEREKAKREKAERERKEREKAERERKEREKAEREKAEREKAERERKEREKAEREKAEREKAERERKEREKAEREKAEREKAERERKEREKAERERAERERKEREKAERERAERERKEREKAEKKKAEKEKKQREKAERKKAKKDKKEHEKKKQEKSEQEKNKESKKGDTGRGKSNCRWRNLPRTKLNIGIVGKMLRRLSLEEAKTLCLKSDACQGVTCKNLGECMLSSCTSKGRKIDERFTSYIPVGCEISQWGDDSAGWYSALQEAFGGFKACFEAKFKMYFGIEDE